MGFLKKMEIEQTSRSGPKLGGWLVEASANWASQVILTSGIALLYLVAMHRVVMLYGFANVFKLRGPLQHDCCHLKFIICWNPTLQSLPLPTTSRSNVVHDSETTYWIGPNLEMLRLPNKHTKIFHLHTRPLR